LFRIAAVALVVLGVGAVVASYTVVPPILERLVGGQLRESMGLRQEPEVELGNEFPPRMLAGNFTHGRIETGEFDLGGLSPDRLTIDLDPFDVDVVGSTASGDLRTTEPLSGTMRVELSEGSVEEIARSQVQDFPVEDVQLSEDGATVSSQATILGVAVPVSVEGGLDVNGDGALVFEPRTVQAFGAPLPETLTDALISGTDFVYPVEGLPYDTRVTGIETREGLLVLSGDVEEIPVGPEGG
jgi:hypothetical protein